jgi:adenine-specific DNA-methyltransferase
LLLANEPIRKTLRPYKDESVDFDTTQNLYIEGDNLDALKLLQETYLGKIKMIYIDPPYNTGNDFIYDDNFSMMREEFEDLAGSRDEDGNAMFQEEKWKQNSSSNGRFHSEWLSMIYPRLKLARNLLREDGVILISIDEGEIDGLKKMTTEIFGEYKYVATLIWKSRQNKDNRPKNGVSGDHEYIVCIGSSLRGDNRKIENYTNPDSDPRGDWASGNMVGIATKDRRPNLHYDLINPETSIVYACPTMGWRYDRNTMARLIAEKRILWPQDSSGRPRKKTFISELDGEFTGYSSIVGNNIYTHNGTKDVVDLFSDRVMDFPKPVGLLRELLEQGAWSNDSIILDFFSGSSTTAHAVMQLNAEDGGKRRHIMVQLPEPCDEKSEAFKAGFKTIAEIGKERIRRAGKKVLAEWQAKQASSAGNLKLNTEPSASTAPDIGFRVLKIESSNMADVYYQPDELTQDGLALQVDNLKPGRKPEDLLFQVLLDWGVDLALPITEETIQHRRVFFVADNALAACFDTGLDEAFVKELAQRQPLRAVFRDSGYASDAVKINFEQIFKALSPHTEIKTL